MDMSMLHAAGGALLIVLDPHRLIFLFGGVLMGLSLGLMPGIGGVAGTAMLLPFTFDMDAHTAFALLLGLGATSTTADPIAAILFGVPGHAASAATTLDGYPMTKRGEAGRALGASYMSALMGGLFGAALMGLTIPLLRPVMLFIGSPELLALSVFGLSMVAVLSGNTPLRGLTMACFGVMLAMIGSDPQTGTLRWTLDSLYLWDGLPLVPITLGLYALPELCDLAIARTAVITDGPKLDVRTGMMLGIKDCLHHWFLVLRCSWLGASMGAIPGIGASVIDWISYGHALRTEKGAQQTFGTGDVRGVIAAESATNAKEGGALVPTVAFGVPTSAGMAILLGAFLIHGLVPGPDMLTKNLDVTYSMVWSIALANVLGSGLCFLLSGQFAKLVTLRYTLILPVALSLIYIGAFQGTRQWGDLYSLLFFGLLGWTMKHFKFPRPPLILGFILGETFERYLFISIERYGISWWSRPVVIVMFIMAFLGLVRPFIQDVRAHGGVGGMLSGFGAPRFKTNNIFPMMMLCLIGAMVIQGSGWNFDAKIVPMIVGVGALFFCSATLLNDIFRIPEAAASKSESGKMAVPNPHQKIHMDIGTSLTHIPGKIIALRGVLFFSWLVGFMLSMATIGLLPTVPLFVIAFMRIEGRERYTIIIPMAICMTFLIYAVFDQFLAIPWPPTVMGDFFPILKEYLPSV